jgi:hypothetical protein
MNHDLFYLFKRRERTKQANKFSLSIVVFQYKIMNNHYANNDNGLNEARNIISQKNSDDLTKLMHSNDEVTKLIGNLNEV